MNGLYRIRAFSDNVSKQMKDVKTDSYLAAYLLFSHIYSQTVLNDVVVIYDPDDEIIEYKVNDDNHGKPHVYHRHNQFNNHRG